MTRAAHEHAGVLDTEFLAVNQFKEEGAFLHLAGLASAALNRRIAAANPNVKVFQVSRSELEGWAYQFTRSVAIAVEYHCDASEPTG